MPMNKMPKKIMNVALMIISLGSVSFGIMVCFGVLHQVL